MAANGELIAGCAPNAHAESQPHCSYVTISCRYHFSKRSEEIVLDYRIVSHLSTRFKPFHIDLSIKAIIMMWGKIKFTCTIKHIIGLQLSTNRAAE